MKRLRLVKVLVQPHYVVDDGENLDEATTEPITVSAADWPAFAETLEQNRLASEAELNTDDDSEGK